MSKEISEKEYKTRTALQNRALHLYFDMIASTLNDAGLDMRAVLKPEVEIPWSKETIKKYLWHPVQKIMVGTESTTNLKTNEVKLVFETLNRHLGEKFGIHEPFPSIEEIIMKIRMKDES